MSSVDGRDDFFMALPPAGASADVPSESRKAIHREPRVTAVVVLLIAIVGAVCFWTLRPNPLPSLPISDPPPNGGSLVAPATIAGAPQAGDGNSPILREGMLPDYDASDVLLHYYLSDFEVHSAISTVALRGPADDLPDPSTMTDFARASADETAAMLDEFWMSQ